MEGFNIVFGEEEIKRFDKQIRDALKLLSKMKITDYCVPKSIQDKIEDLGFHHIHSTGTAYIGLRQIIKFGYLCSEPPELKYRVPTVIVSKHKGEITYEDDYHIIIQPKVVMADKSYFDKTQHVFEDLEYDCGSDVHRGNVGIYRGKPVLIDW